MVQENGFKHVGYLDCKGGGQVVVDGTTAYVGHITGPEATSIIDVTDPKNPKLSERIDLPWKEGTHSHKVRVKDGLMVTNVEAIHYAGKTPDDFEGGLNIYDVSDPLHPKHIKKWVCPGDGVHRYTFDGRYAYLSPTDEGFRANFVSILDLKDPANPVEVGRWWRKGQWEAGGEVPDWELNGNKVPHCHHPIRRGDLLYTSYWHGGLHILDISDMSKPKELSHIDWSGLYGWPCHTCLPIPFKIEGSDILLVADECAVPRWEDAETSKAMLWTLDVTDPTNPIPLSSFRLPGTAGTKLKTCHQPAEDVKGTEIPVAWFNYGLRMVDISDPHNLKEVASYMPDPHPTSPGLVSSNDVCWDDRGLIYVIDRYGGLSIVERV